MPAFISHFCYGLVACFVGAIPFGAINLSVMNISIKKSYQKGMQFALGSSLVEILEAFVAISFGLYIEQYLRHHWALELLIVLFFLSVGLYFFLRSATPVGGVKLKVHSNEFFQGIVVALLNPQAIPFWLFALAFIAPYHIVDFIGVNLYIFLSGVFFGKLLALLLFAKSSTYIRQHLSSSYALVDRSLGTIFIILGIIQAYKFFVV